MTVSPVSPPVVERSVPPRQLDLRTLPQRLVTSARDPWLWVSVLAFLVILCISYALTIQPLDRDEGAFAVIAHGITQGKLPYRDYFDQQGPAIYYLLAVILLIAHGASPLVQAEFMRLSVDIANTVTALGLILLGKKLWSMEIGVLASVLWLISLPFYEGNWFVTEPYMVTFAVLGAAIAAYDPTSQASSPPGDSLAHRQLPYWVRGLVVGVLLAISSMFKQTAILELPGVLLLLAQHPGGWRGRISRWLACLVGFGASWLGVCMAFAFQGALQPLLNDVVWANLAHYPGQARSVLLFEARLYFDEMPLVWLVPLVLAIAFCLHAVLRRRLPGLPTLAMYVLAGLGMLPIVSHDYPHYWLQALPWACLLTSVGIFWLIGSVTKWERITRASVHRAVAINVLLGLIIGVVGTRDEIAPRLIAASAAASQQNAVASWISQKVPANTPLLVGPANPEYYFLANHMPSTKYVYLLSVDSSLYPTAESQVDEGRFQYIVWNPGYGGIGSEYQSIYEAILTHYRVLSIAPANGFVLYTIKS